MAVHIHHRSDAEESKEPRKTKETEKPCDKLKAESVQARNICKVTQESDEPNPLRPRKLQSELGDSRCVLIFDSQFWCNLNQFQGSSS